MVTIKDGCGCDPCDCDWKQKLKEAYSRAIQSVNKIGDETGRVYFPDGTGFVKMPLPTKEQIDSIAEIDGIKASVDELNKTVPALETQVAGVTGSLVSDVKVLNGTTAGKFKVRIEREKASLIDSNDYDLSKVNSIELIQGSGPAMVKAQLTLSDGTVLRSDDFLFTTESIGTDVYISSFTFKAGNVNGTISADIGLNNGVTIEANNFLVPTDPNIISEINDLNTRVSAIEGGSELNELKAAVADLQTNKADVNNTEQIITNKRVDTEIVRYRYNATDAYGIQGSGTETDPFTITGKRTVSGHQVYVPIGKIAVLNTEGVPTNFSAGEVWEEVDLSNWPTNWVAGDRVKIIVSATVSVTADSWTTTPVIDSINVSSTSKNATIIEIEIPDTNTNNVNIPIWFTSHGGALSVITIGTVWGHTYWNKSEGVKNILTLYARAFNANTWVSRSLDISLTNPSNGITKMWRLKK